MTRELSRLLDAQAILCHSSRLLIDPNRRPRTLTSVPAEVDGTVIPGNRDLPPEEVRRRIRAYWLPYHRTIARAIAAFRRRGRIPAIVAVHSFTPKLNGGEPRPWHVGVLWRGDDRLSRPALAALEARGDLVVGDNRPYSGLFHLGYTVEFHAQRARLPHVVFELRQDLIADADGARRFAQVLAEVLEGPLADPDLYTLFGGGDWMLAPVGLHEETGEGRKALSWHRILQHLNWV
ncbi:hypothetical protein HRbin39_00369 [bacterium HR39]|nr:hypothetical protein HRbin39_00369 [bacterium HR39]